MCLCWNRFVTFLCATIAINEAPTPQSPGCSSAVTPTSLLFLGLWPQIWHFPVYLQEVRCGSTCRSLPSGMKTTRWFCFSAPSRTSLFSSSPSRMKAPKVSEGSCCFTQDAPVENVLNGSFSLKMWGLGNHLSGERFSSSLCDDRNRPRPQ